MSGGPWIGLGGVLLPGLGLAPKRIEELSVGDMLLDMSELKDVFISSMQVKTLRTEQITQDQDRFYRIGRNPDGSRFLCGLPVEEDDPSFGRPASRGDLFAIEQDQGALVLYQLRCPRAMLARLGAICVIALEGEVSVRWADRPPAPQERLSCEGAGPGLRFRQGRGGRRMDEFVPRRVSNGGLR